MVAWSTRCCRPIPQQVGRYRLTGRLGAGGMGVVYRAEGRRGEVALKVVRAELAQDPSFRARFRREVQSCFRVSSAFTARLVDFDTEADAPWMATEFVEGEPLDRLVERTGPLGPEGQVALAAGLAESLVAIHAEDVVHRDLKPANVMCTESGPKVIDFGIATAMDALPMTQVGMVIGSPGWITPEQLLTGEATPASDVFAWGCLVAYAASGVQPYGTGQIQTVFWRVLNQPPYVDRDRVSPVLCELVDAAVAYEPAARPSRPNSWSACSPRPARCASARLARRPGPSRSRHRRRLRPRRVRRRREVGGRADRAGPRAAAGLPAAHRRHRAAGGCRRAGQGRQHRTGDGSAAGRPHVERGRRAQTCRSRRC